MGVLVVQSFNNGFETLLGPIFVLLYLITKVHYMPPIFSCVFCIRHFFYGMGEKIVKMSNDKFGSFFPVFLIRLTYDPIEGIWGGEDPHFEFWHTYLHEFLSQQREKLELFAIQYMTCHEQGTFFFALLMAEFMTELLELAKCFLKKCQKIISNLSIFLIQRLYYDQI